MTDRNELSEVIAQCTNCGNVYASHVNPDGTVSPIGQRNGCSCGSSEFTVLEGDRTAAGPPPGTERDHDGTLRNLFHLA
ncbi:hypothetical protein ACFQS4_08640 [Saliphagus sp. GCM10025317]